MTSVSGQPAATRLVQLSPSSLTIVADTSNPEETRLTVQGEVFVQPDRRYDRISIEYTVRGSRGQIIVRESSSVDREFEVQGRITFSTALYLRAPLDAEATTVELRAHAYVIAVDEPQTLEVPRIAR